MASPEIPAFPNETAEAAWWDSNQDWIVEQFQRADATGRLGHGRALAQVRGIQTDSRDTALTIQLPQGDLARAHSMAAKRGMPYEVLLQKLIHDGLEREEQAA